MKFIGKKNEKKEEIKNDLCLEDKTSSVLIEDKTLKLCDAERDTLAFVDSVFTSDEPRMATVVGTPGEYRIIASRNILANEEKWISFQKYDDIDKYLDYLYINGVEEYIYYRIFSSYLEPLIPAVILKKNLLIDKDYYKGEHLKIADDKNANVLFWRRNVIRSSYDEFMISRIVEAKKKSMEGMNNIPSLEQLYIDFKEEPRPNMYGFRYKR